MVTLSLARGVFRCATRGEVVESRRLGTSRGADAAKSVVSSLGGGAVSCRVQARGEVWWRMVVRQSSDHPPGISSDGSCVGEERME